MELGTSQTGTNHDLPNSSNLRLPTVAHPMDRVRWHHRGTCYPIRGERQICQTSGQLTNCPLVVALTMPTAIIST